MISVRDDVLEWLMDGPSWVSFAVETQLLGRRSDPSLAWDNKEIGDVIERLRDERSGFPALRTGKLSYISGGNVYWDLYFLADIGLSIDEIKMDDEVEAFLGLQRDDGTFILREGTRPSFLCIPSIILSSLARMGYGDDPRIRRFIDLALEQQRLDGGWHCALNRSKGKRLQDTPSCPMDNQNLLRLFGQYPTFRTDPRFNGAVDLLLDHWTRRSEPWRPYGFGIGGQFMKIRYPETKYGILRVLDALSPYPYAIGRPEYRDILNSLLAKAVDGRFYAESVSRSYSTFDFGQTKAPSRWITFLVHRLIKRSGPIII